MYPQAYLMMFSSSLLKLILGVLAGLGFEYVLNMLFSWPSKICSLINSVSSGS